MRCSRPERFAQAEGAAQQRIGLVQLGVVEPAQQALHPGQRRARRVLQQFQNGDVQRAGGGFQRVDRDIALAAFDVGQETLAQAGIGRQRLACHAAAGAPGTHPRAQLGEGGFGFDVQT